MLEIEYQVVLTNMYKYMLHFNLQFVWWALNKIENEWMKNQVNTYIMNENENK
jgi:hypothetical protein